MRKTRKIIIDLLYVCVWKRNKKKDKLSNILIPYSNYYRVFDKESVEGFMCIFQSYFIFRQIAHTI